MSEAIGIRLEEEFLKKIEKISRKEVLDQSTTIRKLLEEGYQWFIKKKAIEDYVKGKVSFSEAARKAEVTLWEMEQLLVEHGFHSSYSLEDLRAELELLKNM